MNQRHDEPGRDEQGRPTERTSWRADPSQRQFYPGNHGFEEANQAGYGPPGQAGQGSGLYGASQYTSGAHQPQYTHPPGQYNNPPGQYNNPPGQYNNPPGQYEGPSGGTRYRGEPRDRSAQYGSPSYADAQNRYPPGQYEPGGFDPQHRGGSSGSGPYQGRGFSSFAQQSFGHGPFGHAGFGESNEPHYFGTGTQGYGGGPSFTGGTYGYADRRSDAPLFEEVGFNRGRNENGPSGVSGYQHPNRFMSGPSRERPRYRTGPKGYQRSDERLREDISERLMQAYHVDSSEVTVQVLGGKVILEGSVPDRYMKHEIEDLAANAPGVQDVENRIRVGQAPEGTLTTMGGSNTGSAGVGSNPSNANASKERSGSRSATPAERSPSLAERAENSGRGEGPGR